MLVEYDYWKNNWKKFGHSENGFVEISKNPSIGAAIDFLTGQIEIEYLRNYIFIKQGINRIDRENVSVSFLVYEFCFDNTEKLSLSINKRDIFDKLFFSKRIKLGDDKFDYKYTIKSSKRDLALKIFKYNYVKDMFLYDPFLIFNIKTKSGKTTVKMKHMEKRLYTVKEMKKKLNDFKHILSLIT
jgi:hypothetical protein